eukprot:SAG11_NODE_2594_length_3186_cov_1.603822_1_plen_81_part_00
MRVVLYLPAGTFDLVKDPIAGPLYRSFDVKGPFMHSRICWWIWYMPKMADFGGQSTREYHMNIYRRRAYNCHDDDDDAFY